MTDKTKRPKDDFLENIWGKRASGMEVINVDWDRPISHQDVQYLLDRYPFLQLLSSNPEFDEDVGVTFVTSKQSGWVIHDYGPALSSSPGQFLYGEGVTLFTEDDDSDGGEGSDGRGTISNQAFHTAIEMVELARQKGWLGIEIIDGHERMKWAAWVAAKEYGLEVLGYEPDEEAEQKRERVKHMFSDGNKSHEPHSKR